MTSEKRKIHLRKLRNINKKKSYVVGERFGRLLCTKMVDVDDGPSKCKCTCDCGKEIKVSVNSLRMGNTKSCGCLHIEGLRKISKNNATHRMTNTPEYNVWRGMLKRCYNKSHISYKHYGEKGITVCEEWKYSFENFISDMGIRPKWAKTIDRKDGEKGYNKDNCRWTDWKTQLRNRPNYNRMVTYKGQTKCASEWAEIYNIDVKRFRSELIKGKTLEEILWSEYIALDYTVETVKVKQQM